MNTNLQSNLIPQSLNRPGLPAQARALAAVARREWQIFRRYPTWIVALLIWPVIFPAAYVLTARALSGPDGSGLALFQQATGTANYMGFIAIGTTVWMIQNIVLWDVGFALRSDQLRGTLESNWLSPTWRFSFLLGHSATQLVSTLMFLVVSAIEFRWFFGVRYEGSLLLALVVLLAGLPSIYGVGIAFASLVITAKEANAFVFLVRGVVMIFCGITYPISLLPGWMQSVAAWLPPTYLIQGMRKVVLEGAGIRAVAPELLALLGFGAFWLSAGYLMFRWMERRARQTGAIGQY